MTAHHNFSAYYQPLSDDLKTALKQTKVWTEESAVSLERLSQVMFYHHPLKEGTEFLQGEMIVLDTVAPYVAKIFDALKEHQFRIHQAKSIHHYQGDDVKSMEDNNSSAFNFRKIAGKDKLSIHSYGVAIDINPIQNPFIDPSAPEPNYQPLNAKDYLDRSQLKTGMIDGKVIQIFKENGFPTTDR